jgi:hypothetical protein
MVMFQPAISLHCWIFTVTSVTTLSEEGHVTRLGTAIPGRFHAEGKDFGL